jgi:hypothetical protein
VAIGAFAAEQAEELVEEAEVVYGYGEFYVATVTRTAEQCRQAAGRASALIRSWMVILFGASSSRIVQKGTQCRVMETSRYGMQQRVKGCRVRYALDRERLDVAGGEEVEFYTVDRGRNGLRRVHGAKRHALHPRPLFESVKRREGAVCTGLRRVGEAAGQNFDPRPAEG